mgnify:CR=1 FL=1
MAYTEIKEKNGRKYYYRVKTIRNKDKFKKKRIYLGKNLSPKELSEKEKEANNTLITIKKTEFLKILIPKIKKILKKNKIKRAGIFGSYVRGEQTKDSDIDILVQPSKNMGFEFAGLEIQLSQKLKKKVDLVSYNGLSPYLKDKILSQEIRII